MSALEIIAIVVAASIGVATLWFWITMIVRCVRRTLPGSKQRYAWLLIVVLGKLTGAIIYYLIVERGIGVPPASGETASVHV